MTDDIFKTIRAEFDAIRTEFAADTAALRRRPHRALNKEDLDFSSYQIEQRKCSRCRRTFFCAGGGTSYCTEDYKHKDRNERRREKRAGARAERLRTDRRERRCEVCGAPLLDQVRTHGAIAATRIGNWLTGVGVSKMTRGILLTPAATIARAAYEPRARRP